MLNYFSWELSRVHGSNMPCCANYCYICEITVKRLILNLPQETIRDHFITGRENLSLFLMTPQTTAVVMAVGRSILKLGWNTSHSTYKIIICGILVIVPQNEMNS